MNNQQNLTFFLNNSSSVYYVITDLDGKYEYINSLFSKIFGYSQKEISKQKFEETIYEGDVADFRMAMQECFSKPGETVTIDLRKPRSDGSLFWTRWEFCARLNADNEITGLQGIGSDITERKRAELEKLQAQENLQLLLNNTDESFIMVNTDLNILSYNVSANKMMLESTGVALKAGLPILMFVDPDRSADFEDAFAAAKSGIQSERELLINNLNGSSYLFSTAFKPVKVENVVSAIIITSRDITKTKHAEAQLIANERHFRALIENSADALLIVTPEGNFTDISPTAQRILGYSAASIREQAKLNFIHHEDLEMVRNAFRQVISEENNITTIECRAKTVNNQMRWISATLHNLLHEPNIRGVVINFNDITQRKEAESALLVSEEKYRFLFYNNPQPMWVYDKESLRFIEVNSAALSHYGYTEEEFLSMTILEIRPVEDKTKVLQRIRELGEMPGMTSSGSSWRHLRKNGEIIIVSIKSHPIEYNGKKAVLVSVNDLTTQITAEIALKKSNERFELAGTATSDAIWDADLVNETIHWGKGFETLFGYNLTNSRTDAYTWLNNIYPDDKERVLANHDAVIHNSQETFWKDEYRFTRADGSIAHVIDKGIIMRDEDGVPFRMIGAMQDITERKEAEVKLLRERYLLRTLIDHLPDYIYVKDTNFRHIINNKANVELIGAAAEEETLGKTVVDYFGENANDYLEKDRQIIETGVGVNNTEEAIRSRSGQKRWLLTTKVPLKDDRNRVIGLVGISRDITERKNIEESLKISNERYKIVSKATNDAIWDWSLNNNVVIYNDAIESLFGYEKKEIGEFLKWWEEKIHPADRQRVINSISHNISELRENWQAEYRFACANGEYKYIYDRGFLLLDDHGNPYRMIGAMMDITERKNLEDELASQKITRQRQITEATIQAQEKERSEIGRELHDNINQILTTTKLYIDMAINEEEIREELLHKSHKNVSTAIEEIRILSKSLVPPSLGDIGIKEAISEMVTNLNIAHDINIKLKASGFGQNPISGNKKLMVFRIVQEQINNIVKHSQATNAEIKLAVNRKMLNITVSDNGVGFDTRRKTKGIGLSNITSRAELYNGQVELVSSPGKGCILKVSIPV